MGFINNNFLETISIVLEYVDVFATLTEIRWG